MMAISFEAVKAGDVLYDVHKYKTQAGSRTGCWTVQVISIDYIEGCAMVSWNGNSPQKYRRNDFNRLRRSRPE